MPTNEEREKLAVIQADRDAAAAVYRGLYEQLGAKPSHRSTPDDDDLVQAFARHRTLFADHANKSGSDCAQGEVERLWGQVESLTAALAEALLLVAKHSGLTPEQAVQQIAALQPAQSEGGVRRG